MDADVMLCWMSELAGGRLRALRDRICWFMDEESVHQARSIAGRWIRDAVTLGRINVDWRSDTWVIAEPVLTTIPGGYGYALLTGGRPHSLVEKLARADDEYDPVLSRAPGIANQDDLPAPTAVFIGYSSADDLQAAAKTLGVRFIPGSYRQLADNLQMIGVGERAACPSRQGAPIGLWSRVDKRFTALESSGAWIDGLYRQEINGTQHYSVHRNGEWYRTERAEGVYLAARPSDDLVRWRPESGRGLSALGSFMVDNGASLPDAQRRILGLCSGFGPRISRQTQSTTYVNVPRDIAETVAASLRQQLTILPARDPKKGKK
ncbi:hypothetical protein [Rhodococcus sp. IEGM 1307]|uniref:hypothetical protein n=1 Tax=Rhodococcus sp. IEGM 1307 TaxID=3047091 RepID=UPI0024B69587|nr:hypothetical protein [Rhodococcus sp. IEGM 1307]MDI9979352.1 hypothetical protein [Rhodococcus sp. IEGM 1307]